MMGNKIALNDAVFRNDENVAIAYGMGITAEKVAQQWKVTRDEQDAFAAFWWLATAKASWSSRDTFHCFATFSAVMPMP